MSFRDRIGFAGGLAAVLLTCLLSAPGIGVAGGPDGLSAFEQVMPPYASAGRTIVLYARPGTFSPGQHYRVSFGRGPTVETLARHADHLSVRVPEELEPGATALAIQGDGVALRYHRALFTALATPETLLAAPQDESRSRRRAALEATHGSPL